MGKRWDSLDDQTRPKVASLFRDVMRRVVTHVLIVGFVTTAVSAIASDIVVSTTPLWVYAGGLTLAFAGLSAASLLPGAVLPATRDAGARAGMLMLGGTAAMAIRSVGTVALVVGCRYKIAAAGNEVDQGGLVYLMIGLGYAATTFDEVRLLAVGTRRLDAVTDD